MYLSCQKHGLKQEGAEETCLVGAAVYERLIVVVKAFISKVSANDATSCNPHWPKETWNGQQRKDWALLPQSTGLVVAEDIKSSITGTSRLLLISSPLFVFVESIFWVL